MLRRHMTSQIERRRRRPQDLTAREMEVLNLIWFGLSNRQIGHRLSISVKTVEAYRATLMRRIHVSNVAQLLKAALGEGLIKAK